MLAEVQALLFVLLRNTYPDRQIKDLENDKGGAGRKHNSNANGDELSYQQIEASANVKPIGTIWIDGQRCKHPR